MATLFQQNEFSLVRRPAQLSRAMEAKVNIHSNPSQDVSLARAVLDAGGVVRTAEEGQTAFRWQGHPRAFVLITRGKLTVHFRTDLRP